MRRRLFAALVAALTLLLPAQAHGQGHAYGRAKPHPSPSSSPTVSPTPTPTPTPTATESPSLTPTATPTSSPTVTPTAARTPLVPAGITGLPAHLAFNDDFDGTALDAGKWSTCYTWRPDGPCTNTGNSGDYLEAQCYTPDNVTVSGGLLHLTAKVQQSTCEGLTKQWTSGMVQNYTKGFGTGEQDFYAEERLRSALGPNSPGMWGASWTVPLPTYSPNWPPEEDHYEQLGNPAKGDKVSPNYHDPANAQCGTDWYLPGQTTPGSGELWSAAMHTFGVWRSPTNGWVKFYVDGILAKTCLNASYPVTNRSEFLILDLAVRDYYDDPTGHPGPFDMQVDYAAVWTAS
jgi:beta-glucanase (GH16 family)